VRHHCYNRASYTNCAQRTNELVQLAQLVDAPDTGRPHTIPDHNVMSSGLCERPIIETMQCGVTCNVEVAQHCYLAVLY
jgi:hypothetical protein